MHQPFLLPMPILPKRRLREAKKEAGGSQKEGGKPHVPLLLATGGVPSPIS